MPLGMSFAPGQRDEMNQQGPAPTPVQQAIQKPWRASEELPTLLQIDIHTTEGHVFQAVVCFIGPKRHVHGQQQSVDARLAERADERVALQATAAVHAAGPGHQVKNSH